MAERDLLEIFDAVLPRLRPYVPSSVPKAGASQLQLYEMNRSGAQSEFNLFLAATAALGLLTWLMWVPYMPFIMLYLFAAATAASGAVTLKRFAQLAATRQPERALPEGTDLQAARLEDGTRNLIRDWNEDVHFWNEEVAKLRELVAGWQVLHLHPAARDIEWTEHGSKIQAEGLYAAMRGLIAEREALLARKDEIDHRIRTLDARLLRLKAADDRIIAALPPGEPEDPPDDG